MGLDPQADRDKVHEIVGVQLQESSFPARLRVGEILDMYPERKSARSNGAPR